MNRLHALRFTLASLAAAAIIALSLGHDTIWGWVGSAGLLVISWHFIMTLTSTAATFRHRRGADLFIDTGAALLAIGAIALLTNLPLSLALLAGSYQLLSLRHQRAHASSRGLLRRHAAAGLNRLAIIAILFGLGALACLLFPALRGHLPPVLLVSVALLALLRR